jgi:two-component system nitrate/nitrite response regulator NarL
MPKTVGRNIRVLLIDDHTLFRESVARLLQSEPDFEVVAHCSSCTQALQIMKSREIDIVLLDLDLGPERGTDFVERLRREGLEGKILIVTAGASESEFCGLIRKGVDGILMKNSSPALLIQGIRETMEGRVLIDQDLLNRAQGMEVSSVDQHPVRFTGREKQVLSFVFEGLANKQIGDRLRISESAVKACLQQLFAKTGVRTRSQLVRVALEQYRDQI